jgi:TIR domain
LTSLVRPLAHALRTRDVEVWYDEFVLKIGDSLRRKIDKGLIASQFGVVVLSPSFFGKGWPNHELDGLVTREVAGNRQLILPIWHKVTKADVVSYSPSLADKVARSTADATMEELADEIAGVVRPVVEAA